MTREFDPRRSYLTVKAHDKMIAYAGFTVDNRTSDSDQQGVVKVSSFEHPYGGEQYILTFIVDAHDDDELKKALNARFDSLNEASFKPYLGKNMQKLVKVSLDSLKKIPQRWFEAQ